MASLMNKLKRNVVFVGFTKTEQQTLRSYDVRYNANLPKVSSRFPYVIFVSDLKEALKHQGFALVMASISSEAKLIPKLKTKYQEIFYCESTSSKTSANCTFLSKRDLFTGAFLLNLNIKYSKHQKLLAKNLNLNQTLTLIAKEKPHLLTNYQLIMNYLKTNPSSFTKDISASLGFPLRSTQRYLKTLANNLPNLKYNAQKRVWEYF